MASRLTRPTLEAPQPFHCRAVSRCKATNETSSKVLRVFQTTRTCNHPEEVKVAILTTTLINFTNNKCSSRCISNLVITLSEVKASEVVALLLETQVPDLLTVITNTATKTLMNSSLKARRSSMLHLLVKRASRLCGVQWCLKELRLRILARTKVLLRSRNKAATIYEKDMQLNKGILYLILTKNFKDNRFSYRKCAKETFHPLIRIWGNCIMPKVNRKSLLPRSTCNIAEGLFQIILIKIIHNKIEIHLLNYFYLFF